MLQRKPTSRMRKVTLAWVASLKLQQSHISLAVPYRQGKRTASLNLHEQQHLLQLTGPLTLRSSWRRTKK